MFQGQIHFDPPKPAELISVDADLWAEFTFHLYPHVYKLNAYMCIFWTTYLLFVAPLVIFYHVASGSEGLLGEFFYTHARSILFFPILLIFVFQLALYNLIKRNHQADDEIRRVCEDYGAKFLSSGFAPEYRIRYTGYCRPRYAKPMRAIVFLPLSGNTQIKRRTAESFSIDDSRMTEELIDRKAWGLEETL